MIRDGIKKAGSRKASATSTSPGRLRDSTRRRIGIAPQLTLTVSVRSYGTWFSSSHVPIWRSSSRRKRIQHAVEIIFNTLHALFGRISIFHGVCLGKVLFEVSLSPTVHPFHPHSPSDEPWAGQMAGHWVAGRLHWVTRPSASLEASWGTTRGPHRMPGVGPVIQE